ncbi:MULTISPECIES: hypothetical protein [unclassified Saccharopolyspora]|uniref:hypothetical protein n=1 Tax=Saccharopolyspora TaxID=1835 RepID=UPI001F3C4514|nr:MULTISPECIES: hypothetical protein [unclassified Saccharopolyspora]
MVEQDRPRREDESPDGQQPSGADRTGGTNGDEPTEQVHAPRGRVRQQDAETATPREPTLSEQRARVAAEKRREEQEQRELDEAERKTQKRRRVMVGGGVTVGVVALVSAFYSGAAYSEQKNAVEQYCAAADQQPGQTTVERPELCNEDYVRSQGGYPTGGGMMFMPIFFPGTSTPIPGQGHSYRYGYTQPGTSAPPVGGTVNSPNFNKPSGATVKDGKGTTVSRGGFGINSKGTSGS